MRQPMLNPPAFAAVALFLAGMALCCAALPARGDAYDHRAWYRDRGRSKDQTEIKFDKDRFIEYKYPAEGFAIKEVDVWSVGNPEAGWVTHYTAHVHGGMKVTPLPPKSTTTLESATKARMDAIRSRLKAEGGKLVSITSTPAKFCGFAGRRIEQKFTFSDVPDPIICVSHIAIGNNTEYLLDVAAFESLYKDKTYHAMLEETATSAHPLPKGVRSTKLPATDAEIDTMIAQALSQLKEKNDGKRKIVYKYPSNWQIRQPYELMAGETVILFDSPKGLVHGAIFAKELFPGQTIDSLAKERIDHYGTWASKLDFGVVKNEPAKFGGHDGRRVQVRFAQHYDYTDPLSLSDKYIAIANGKVYELEINAPEAAFPKVQKLVEAIVGSIKF